jgi:hypothetical protein
MGGADACETCPPPTFASAIISFLGLFALCPPGSFFPDLGLNFRLPVGVETTSLRFGVDLKMSLVNGRKSESKESTTASKVRNNSVT